jgi:hydroxyacylglutathione hydrolase
VHQLPAATDNLIWLLVDVASREAAAVDGPEAGTVLDHCRAHGLNWTTVFNTHTHGDHIGINRDLAARGLLSSMRVVGYEGMRDVIPGITETVNDGSNVAFGGSTGQVLLTEGHLDGHVSYVFEDVLFCGDTLFGAGCGYLFSGPPGKMHESLSRLCALPAETWVCCAHEYTEDNLRFAWSVEPDNTALAERIRRVFALRARGECSMPSQIGEELATNPFVRHASVTLRRNVALAMPERPLSTPPEVFAATRALKDRGDHKRLMDSELPLG